MTEDITPVCKLSIPFCWSEVYGPEDEEEIEEETED